MDNEKIKNDGTADVVPTFTPPTPTFEPPKDAKPQFNGPACYYHNDEPAVSRCARCGKNLCKDCCDSYGVSSGQYAGKHLCYDCTQKLVSENIQALQQNYATIKGQYIICIIGCVIGAIIGAIWGASGGAGGALIYAILCAAIGGSAGNFFKRFFSSVPGFFVSTGNIVLSICVGLFKFVACFFIYAIVALFETIKKIVYFISYMKRTSGFIESDTAALQQMADYMEYTMIRNKNKGVDIETLINQKSELADNSYAQMVQSQGEDAAEANLRQSVCQINEHGEIIRSFQGSERVAA